MLASVGQGPGGSVGEETVRVLVVGAGRMGALRVQDLSADPRVSQVLVANRSPARAEQVAAVSGARAVSWDGIGEHAAVADAVVVASATGAHAAVLERVLPAGRPVLCEKPFALTLADTERLIALAAAHGAELQVGFQRRFDAGLLAMRRRMAAGG
jgi:myo-inositol 2-dehydrogenase/D-chiro-inositol 1-dehydrogenase